MSLFGKRWREAHIGFEDDGVRIGGVEVWKAEWRSAGESVELPHPAHPKQIHRYSVYEAENGVKFAAAELSAGVWGFYVQT